MSVEVNIKHVLNTIDKYDQKVARIVQEEIFLTSLDIETDAKRAAAVDTGYMRASGGRKVEKFEAIVFFKAIYAKFVEFGTRFMAARPFLHPAFERHRKLMMQRLKRKISTSRT